MDSWNESGDALAGATDDQARRRSAKRRRRSLRVYPPLPMDSMEPRPARRAFGRTLIGGILSLVLVALFPIGLLGFFYGILAGVPHRGEVSHHAAWTGTVARYAWCVFLMGGLVWGLRRGELAGAWAVARRVTWRVIGQNLLVLALTVTVAVLLNSLFPWLNRSWIYLLPSFQSPGFQGSAININLLPMQIKGFGVAFLLLFAVSVPRLARSEEMTYRRGTFGWRDGAARSLRLGLVHCFAGIPLYAALALTVGGLWFTLQYFRGGVENSTLHHATYNWIVTAICLMVALVWAFG